MALGFGAAFGALRGQGWLSARGASVGKAATRAEPLLRSPTLRWHLVVPPVFALPRCVRALYCRAATGLFLLLGSSTVGAGG